MKATGTAPGITRHLSSALSALRDLLALTGAAAILAFLLLPLREPVERALMPIVLPTLPSVVMDQVVAAPAAALDRKSTRLNSSHLGISYAVFCLKKKSK